MIIWKKGSIFKSNCQTLVNTVNCKGIMGKGLALQFKQRYPKMFKEYQFECSIYNSDLKLGGDIWVYDLEDQLFNPKKILCFATKVDWRYPSKLEWIERGLMQFRDQYAYFGITSCAWPKLGCTNGQLNWENDVKPLMELFLNQVPIKCEIYE